MLQDKFDLPIYFDLMINFDFFDLIAWTVFFFIDKKFPHGMSVKFGLWTFHEFLTFSCPNYKATDTVQNNTASRTLVKVQTELKQVLIFFADIYISPKNYHV